jgi:hypothetical protein
MWVLIVLIITGGIVLVAMFTAAARGATKELTPKQALELRFANGKISEAEFLRSMAVLDHDRLLELED